MTLTDLEYYNAINAQIGEILDKLMGDKSLQLVFETNNEKQYWLANHENTNNGVPVLLWCYEEEKGDEDDIENIHDWCDLRDEIFQLVTSEKVIDFYLEYM